MSLAKDTLKAILGEDVQRVHQGQKDQEQELNFYNKLKLRLAKKTNWIAIVSLGFAIAEKNPVEIVTSGKILLSWFF